MFQIRMILQLSVIDMTKQAKFNYTDSQQATLLSSYFYGYVSIMVRSPTFQYTTPLDFWIPLKAIGGAIVARLGPKFVAIASLSGSSICSIMFPWGRVRR